MAYKYKTKPYKHQRKVLNMSWKRIYFGLLMWMGTGKTKVIIDNVAALFEAGECDSLVIVAPKSIVHNWIDELEIHMPNRIKYHADVWEAGMGKGRSAELERLQDRNASILRILIINTEGIWRDKAYDFVDSFMFRSQSFMVVDESTMLKNIKAKRTKACIKLGSRAKYRRILTGQPVPQGPLDLYAQCEFLQPGCLGFATYTAFKSAYAITQLVDLGGRKKFEQLLGYKNVEDLKARLHPFTFVASKEECLDLPPKVFQRIEVTMSKEQQKAYDSMRDEALAEFDGGELCTAEVIMTQMLRLHQITCGYLPDDDGKLHPMPNNRLNILMDELVPNVAGKAIIWTHFTHSIDSITEALVKKYGAEAVADFQGKTPSKARQDIVHRFQDLKDPLRFIVANKTAAYGLTLHAAADMIYYTNQWALDVRQQSEDRAHRSGLDHSVLYTDMVCPGTIDETILKALRKKEDIARQVLSRSSSRAFVADLSKGV